MRSRSVYLLALFLFLASAASANEITYYAKIDTSLIANSPGYIEFQFDQGNASSQPATASVYSFAFDGSYSASPQITNDVTGTLPADLTFDNGTTYDDYFQGITFGDSIFFTLHLYGPALESPNGTASAGSTFAFSMWDSSGTTSVLSDSGDGSNFTVAVNLDGTTTLDTSHSEGTADIQTPEPVSLLLAGAPLLVFALRRRRRRPPIAG